MASLGVGVAVGRRGPCRLRVKASAGCMPVRPAAHSSGGSGGSIGGGRGRLRMGCRVAGLLPRSCGRVGIGLGGGGEGRRDVGARGDRFRVRLTQLRRLRRLRRRPQRIHSAPISVRQWRGGSVGRGLALTSRRRSCKSSPSKQKSATHKKNKQKKNTRERGQRSTRLQGCTICRDAAPGVACWCALAPAEARSPTRAS